MVVSASMRRETDRGGRGPYLRQRVDAAADGLCGSGGAAATSGAAGSSNGGKLVRFAGGGSSSSSGVSVPGVVDRLIRASGRGGCWGEVSQSLAADGWSWSDSGWRQSKKTHTSQRSFRRADPRLAVNRRRGGGSGHRDDGRVLKRIDVVDHGSSGSSCRCGSAGGNMGPAGGGGSGDDDGDGEGGGEWVEGNAEGGGRSIGGGRKKKTRPMTMM